MKFVLVFMLFLSSAVYASSVKVTSFRFLDSRGHFTPTAEVCGVLLAPTGKPELLKIVADPDTKGPAQYMTWTGKDGKFCHVIATYSGKANIDLE